jgi:hypothetical protein
MRMLHTSEIPLVSSLHGKERRSQRDISKRDLQAAIKYGKREKAASHPGTGEHRWKYTFADVVYITDETSTIEITSWTVPLPLKQVSISDRMMQQYLEAKRRLGTDKDIITSHAVFVVDKSGSMRKSDINGHRTRAEAVYYAIAEEYLALELDESSIGGLGGKLTSFTDVVSVIEMRESPTIVLDREPMSWVLYNKIVDLAGNNNSKCHGMYYASLECAFEMLQKSHDKCALLLFFLTDGRPSDWKIKKARKNGQCDEYQYIMELVRRCCVIFGSRYLKFDFTVDHDYI